MTAATVCPIDGAPIVQPATGRRRRFCSTACQQVGTREARRLVSQLDDMERRRRAAQHEAAAGDPLGFTQAESSFVRERKAEIRRLDRFIAEATSRLRVLLGGDPSTTPVPTQEATQ